MTVRSIARDGTSALVGAVFGALVTALTFGARLAALEQQVEALKQQVAEVHQDVRELRAEAHVGADPPH